MTIFPPLLRFARLTTLNIGCSITGPYLDAFTGLLDYQELSSRIAQLWSPEDITADNQSTEKRARYREAAESFLEPQMQWLQSPSPKTPTGAYVFKLVL